LTAAERRANNGLVRTGFFAREWVRTCKECGYTWRVPRSIARRGIRGMSAMSVIGRTAGAGYGSASRSPISTSQIRADIGARAEQMEGFRICARCGVDDFTQRPVRRGETPSGQVPQP
jgi:predicted nucleic-acid-binding Zn-ribbon protein